METVPRECDGVRKVFDIHISVRYEIPWGSFFSGKKYESNCITRTPWEPPVCRIRDAGMTLFFSIDPKEIVNWELRPGEAWQCTDSVLQNHSNHLRQHRAAQQSPEHQQLSSHVGGCLATWAKPALRCIPLQCELLLELDCRKSSPYPYFTCPHLSRVRVLIHILHALLSLLKENNSNVSPLSMEQQRSFPPVGEGNRKPYDFHINHNQFAAQSASILSE